MKSMEFDKFDALTPVKQSEVTTRLKIMITAWATKRRASGKLRGRLNAQGYNQID